MYAIIFYLFLLHAKSCYNISGLFFNTKILWVNIIIEVVRQPKQNTNLQFITPFGYILIWIKSHQDQFHRTKEYFVFTEMAIINSLSWCADNPKVNRCRKWYILIKAKHLSYLAKFLFIFRTMPETYQQSDIKNKIWKKTLPFLGKKMCLFTLLFFST